MNPPNLIRLNFLKILNPANGLSNVLFGLTEFITGSTFFFWACLILRIIEAFGCTSHITASYTFVIKKFPDDISYVFSLTESFIGAGLALGPAFGGIIYSQFGYGVPFYIFGSFVLICLPISWYFVESIEGIFDNLPLSLPNLKSNFA